MDDMENGGLVTRLTKWLAHPYRSDMSALDWALFLGLIMIISFFWTRVLQHIAE